MILVRPRRGISRSGASAMRRLKTMFWIQPGKLANWGKIWSDILLVDSWRNVSCRKDLMRFTGVS